MCKFDYVGETHLSEHTRSIIFYIQKHLFESCFWIYKYNHCLHYYYIIKTRPYKKITYNTNTYIYYVTDIAYVTLTKSI